MSFRLLRVLTGVLLTLSPASSSLGNELQPTQQYGFPLTNATPDDLLCHMVSRNGNTLDLARLCGGTPQVRAVPRQEGLVFSNIKFENPTRAEREVRNVGLKITGRLTNRSTEVIRARVIDYNISAFNGRNWEVLVRPSEYLLDNFRPVIIEPGQSIPFVHELNLSQARRFNGYMMFSDNFRFTTTGTRNDLIDIDPR